MRSTTNSTITQRSGVNYTSEAVTSFLCSLKPYDEQLTTLATNTTNNVSALLSITHSSGVAQVYLDYLFGGLRARQLAVST